MTTHPNRSTTCRPREHLRAAARLYPDAWQQLENMRRDQGHGLPSWPDWCYCPLAGAYAIVSGGGDNRLGLGETGDVGRLGALAAWRMTQGVYRFDPALYAAITATPLTGDLPSDLLHHLPEWCVYIETPGLGPLGVFVHMEWDAATDGREELRLLLDYPDTLITFPLHLGPWPLSEAVERSVAESRRQAINHGSTIVATQLAAFPVDDAARHLSAIVSLTLYLCSERPDIDVQPTNPEPKKTRHGWKLFPADTPRTWDVGQRIGSALRSAYLAEQTNSQPDTTDTGRARPRAHVRAAHWHTYLTGQGRANRVLRWIPPVPVNVDGFDDLPATIRPVKK